MNPRFQFVVLLLFVSTSNIKLTKANVLFRFKWDFAIKDGVDSEEQNGINKTFIIDNNQVSLVDNNSNTNDEQSTSYSIDSATVGPAGIATADTSGAMSTDISEDWATSTRYQSIIDSTFQNKVMDTVVRLERELMPLVGRSDLVAAKAKLLRRFLNHIDSTPSMRNKLEVLQQFVILVDDLKDPTNIKGENDERSLDYVLVNLVYEKHQLFELQRQIKETITAVDEAWQLYKKTKTVTSMSS